MEKIVYRITLDLHKSGIQGTLQGFETADVMSRSIAVNLTASGDTYEIPLDNVVAMMYVTTPNASEPSINECRIEDNTVIYDVLPIVEEGITEMQLKLIETSMDGAKSVLVAPRFAVEVTESSVDDGSAEQTVSFTVLENAIARANSVYNARLLRIEIDADCVFRAIYADGTVYENNYLHEALYNGNALLSESWAKGGTGIREGENTNNSMYFSNVSRSSAIDASGQADIGREMAELAQNYSAFTLFTIDFESGELNYMSANYNFDIDEESGRLIVEGEPYSAEDIAGKAIEEWLHENDKKLSELEKIVEGLEIGSTSARISDVTLVASEWVGSNNLFSQVVAIDSVTENSQVDLKPSITQLAAFYEKDLAFVTENEDGVVTVYAIGQKPQNDYTIQVTITEVA